MCSRPVSKTQKDMDNSSIKTQGLSVGLHMNMLPRTERGGEEREERGGEKIEKREGEGRKRENRERRKERGMRGERERDR